MGLSVKNNSIIKMVHTISVTGHTQISLEPPVVICKLLHKNNFRIKWGGVGGHQLGKQFVTPGHAQRLEPPGVSYCRWVYLQGRHRDDIIVK